MIEKEKRRRQGQRESPLGIPKASLRGMRIYRPLREGTWSPAALIRRRLATGESLPDVCKSTRISLDRMKRFEDGQEPINPTDEAAIRQCWGIELDQIQADLDVVNDRAPLTREQRIERAMAVWEQLMHESFPSTIRMAAARHLMEYLVGKPVGRQVNANISVSSIEELQKRVKAVPIPKGYAAYLEKQTGKSIRELLPDAPLVEEIA